MKKSLIALAVLVSFGVQAQTSTSSSQSASGAQAGSNSGAAAIIYLDQSGPASQTINGTQVLNATSKATTTNTNTNTSTSTDNVNYSGKIENVQSGTSTQNVVYSGGATNTENTNVHYSGTQTVKNVPGIAMSGPASGPCTGASGGLGIAGPGFGVGLNGAKVEPSCVLRENIRVTGMAMQSLDGATNPQEKGALLVMMMDQMRGLNEMSKQIIQEHVKAK